MISTSDYAEDKQMERTARDLSTADIQKYAEAARARSLARQKRLTARETLAWDVARRAAALLKEKFGAARASWVPSSSQTAPAPD